jgi:predicted pyridoxine 5'-phosphate oxidase superfamily flavin-nucleotide-binding protein
MEFYTEAQRNLQDQFQTRPLADRLADTIIVDAIDAEQHQPFIESRDFFFLSTVNDEGEPTVSYKGGGVGIVTVVDPNTIVFPIYDGNGMFLSAGNIASSSKIGLLFIDFETPNRVRVQATAAVSADDPLMSRYPGAVLLVRAHVDKVFVNCARYIHKHQRVESSKYVPDADGSAPYACWKRIDFVQDVLPPADQGRADREGGLITIEEYGARVAAGDS